MKDIEVLDINLDRVGIVTAFESMTFTRSHFSKGSFEIQINNENENAKYLQEKNIIYIDSTKVGFIEKVILKDENDMTTRIVKGIELKDYIYKRLIAPNADGTPLSYAGSTLEWVIKRTIELQLGVASAVINPKRQLALLEYGTNLSRGPSITYSAWRKNLGTEIYSLLKKERWGLKFTIDVVNKKIIYDIVIPNDVSNDTILSTSLKTAKTMTDTYDISKNINLVVCAAAGETANRTVLEVYKGDEEPEGWDRIESYLDTRDVVDETEMQNRGEQKIDTVSKTRSVEAKYNSLGNIKLETDFTLGDILGIGHPNDEATTSAQVIKIKHTYKSDVEDIDLILDYDMKEDVVNSTQAKNMSYDAAMVHGAVAAAPAEETLRLITEGYDYPQIAHPDGSVVQYIKATDNGILPFAVNNAWCGTTGYYWQGMGAKLFYARFAARSSGNTVRYNNTSASPSYLYFYSSSMRYKQNIRTPESEGIDPRGIFKISPKIFDEAPNSDRTDDSLNVLGYIAEEIGEIYPDSVFYEEGNLVDSYSEDAMVAHIHLGLNFLYEEMKKLREEFDASRGYKKKTNNFVLPEDPQEYRTGRGFEKRINHNFSKKYKGHWEDDDKEFKRKHEKINKEQKVQKEKRAKAKKERQLKEKDGKK